MKDKIFILPCSSLTILLMFFLCSCGSETSPSHKETFAINQTSILTTDEMQLINDLGYYNQPELWKVLTKQHPAYVKIKADQFSSHADCTTPTIKELSAVTQLGIKHPQVLELGFTALTYRPLNNSKTVPASSKITYGKCRWADGDVHGGGCLHKITLTNEKETLLRYEFQYSSIQEHATFLQHQAFLKQHAEAQNLRPNDIRYIYDNLVFRIGKQSAGHYYLEV